MDRNIELVFDFGGSGGGSDIGTMGQSTYLITEKCFGLLIIINNLSKYYTKSQHAVFRNTDNKL